MSRPCTDRPITRVSLTNDAAIVVDVVDCDVVDVVDVDVVVSAAVVVGSVVVGGGVVDVVDSVCEVDEQATSGQITSGASHHDLALIGSGFSWA